MRTFIHAWKDTKGNQFFWLRKQLTKAKQRAQNDFNDFDDDSTDKMPFTLNP